MELGPKRLEVLHQLLPGASAMAFLVNPANPHAAASVKDTQNAARSFGLQLHVFEAATTDEIDQAFARIAALRVSGLLVDGDTLFNDQGQRVVDLAARNAIPTIYVQREFVEVGGLLSYGTSLIDGYRQVGNYVGQILKGATPADLPVQQQTKVELVLNFKTANALGITFPISLLGRADEVIE